MVKNIELYIDLQSHLTKDPINSSITLNVLSVGKYRIAKEFYRK